MNALQLNPSPVGASTPADPVAANMALSGGFADALAAQLVGVFSTTAVAPPDTTAATLLLSGNGAEAPALPLAGGGLPWHEHAQAAMNPELLLRAAAELELPEVTAGLPPVSTDAPALLVEGVSPVPVPATALPDAETVKHDDAAAVFELQTPYALGLWNTPAVAPPVPALPRGEARPATASALTGLLDAQAPAKLAAPQAAPAAIPVEATEALAAAMEEATPANAERAPAGKPAVAPQAADEIALPLPLQNARPVSAVPAATAPATTVRLPNGEPSQWQQPLLQALGDRLQLQIATRSDQAVIRLEPPMMGRVEIAIRQQAGELQVRLSATHAEVTRQLQQVSEGLRQDLVQRHSGDVTVQVAQGSRDGADARPFGRDPGRDPQGQPQNPQDQAQDGREPRRPGRALGDDSPAPSRFSAALSAQPAA